MSFLPIDYSTYKAYRNVDKHFEHPDFVTHANYLNFMSVSSEKLKLDCNPDIKKKITLDKKVGQKTKLLGLTFENLVEERENIKKYPEYSVVCTSWIPVKSYYLIFNLLILLEYLITASSTCLVCPHSVLFNHLRRMLSEKIISFSKSIFNHVCTVGEVEDWKIPQWENVKRKDADPQLRYKQILKKLASYSKEEFKRINKIKRLSGGKKEKFMSKEINLCEFFYWYRIKANYRDMEFIDKDVAVQEFVEFYEDYFRLSINFYKAMKQCINSLAMMRTGRVLIT